MLDLPRLDTHQCWTDAKEDPRAVGVTVEALAGFEAMLGDDWSGWARSFPLARRFFVSLQGQVLEGVRLWRMVRALDGVPGLAHVVSQGLARKAWSEYTAATMALEFCSRVRTARGDVEFVERDNGKTPDARVKLVDRWLTVEFKALHDSDEIEPWVEFEQTVLMGLTLRGFAQIAFDRELTEHALSDPQAVVEGLASIATRNSRSYEALPRGTGRARIAPINLGKCGYPVEQQDELVRLTSKLRSKKWWAQLEKTSGPTFLMVLVNAMFGNGEPDAVREGGQWLPRAALVLSIAE